MSPAKSRTPSPRRARKRRPVVSLETLSAALHAQTAGVLIVQIAPAKTAPKIVFANPSFCQLAALTASQLLGKSPNRFHPDATDRDRIRDWGRHARRGDSLAGEGRFQRPDGNSIYISWTFDPLCARDGRATHVVGTYRDLTEARVAQEALAHDQRLEAVGRLAGGVAHDFNNLISVINGYCEIVAARLAADADSVRDITEIHNAGRKAAALTQQLLAFSRQRASRPEVVNLNDLVVVQEQSLRALLKDTSGAVLHVELAPSLWNARIDPSQLQEVLRHLVLNARDALRPAGRILVATANREIPAGNAEQKFAGAASGRVVALRVSDNGVGMDAETQKHLFEPFFTTKSEGKGTGLGLALAYGVVHQSGGTIHAHSAPDVGTTFEILLPAVDLPLTAALQSSPANSAASTRGHETILLIEADDVLRKMVGGILTADGYRVLTAANAAEASQVAAGMPTPVELIMINAARDARRLARRLATLNPSLRVLHVSARGPAPALPWLPPSQHAALAKPFALSELLRAARQLLDATA